MHHYVHNFFKVKQQVYGLTQMKIKVNYQLKFLQIVNNRMNDIFPF